MGHRPFLALLVVLLIAIVICRLDFGGDVISSGANSNPRAATSYSAKQKEVGVAYAAIADPRDNHQEQVNQPDVEEPNALVHVPVAIESGAHEQKLNIRRVVSEKWVGEKAVGGQPAKQRIRIVEADFKYPMLRLEEDVTLDPKTGEEVSEIKSSSVADHLMVGLREGVVVDKVRQLLEADGYRIRSNKKGLFMLVELPEFTEAGDQAEAINRFKKYDEFLDYAEQDWIVHTTVTPNDPAFTEDKVWNFDNAGTIAGTIWDADIDGPDGWDQVNNASSVVVAVTDTGIRHTHEDLVANMWEDGSGFHGWDAYDEDDDPMDINGHGTHVAGIIGARGNNGLGTAGVAWNVRLMALRFIGPSGGTTSDAIRVINYARLNGAHIINASWGGGGYSEGLANAIKACYAADIPVVAAAGNFTRDNDTIIHYPSGYHTPNVVAVASTDANDQLSFFSNYGQVFVDLAAPGGDIWSCGAASDSDYLHLSGTSMAAPHVTGALALAKVRYPGEAFVDIITRLYNSVDTRPQLSGKVATGGRLNLYRLLADSSPDYLHDDFDKPYWFSGCYGYWCYANGRMTREADEDSFSPDTGNKSFWFRWTAPSDGLVRFKGQGAAGDVSVVAFEGVDRNSLTRIADNFKQRPTKVSYLYFYAKVGRTYTFSVDSRLTTSQIVIGELVHHPVNDMWRDATNLGSGDRFEIQGENCGATAEPWENAAPHAGVGNGRSVWWKWTPNFSGDFVISTQSSAIDTVLAVYTGTNPDNLTEVASNDDRNVVDWTSEVTFSAVAGTTYYVAVDSYRGSGAGHIVLNGYVPGSLFILKQPESKLVRIGDPATFTVAAAGQGLRYQWELDGQPIPGAVQSNYNILRVIASDFGNYRVRISDIKDTILSDVATLNEMQISPQIVWQTRSRSVSLGSSLYLRVRATGTPPLNYQWFKNDVAIPGATMDQLDLNNVDGTAAANYTVTVNNSSGFTTSDLINLKVFSSPWNGWNYVEQVVQSGAVFSIVKDAGQWVAASRANNSIRISTSSDGRNWNHSYINPDGTANSLIGMHLTKGNGFWLCAADASGVANDVVYKSTDLVSWQQYVLPIAPTEGLGSGSQLVFHDGYFYLGVYNAIYRSSDGISWALQKTPIGDNIRNGKIVSDGTRLLVTRSSSQYVYVLSNSAGSWQEVDIDPANTTWTSEAYLKSGIFYVYLSNVRYESANGLTWAPSATTPTLDVDRYARWFLNIGSTKFVDTYDGGNYRFYASTDNGVTWTQYQNLTPSGMAVAASDGERIVFGTDLGGLIDTVNPFTVTYPSRVSSSSYVGVGYGGGQFIAQYSSITMVSSDGERWASYPSQVIGAAVDAPPYASVPARINNEYWMVGNPGSSLPATPFYRGAIPGVVRLDQIAGLPNGAMTKMCEGPQGILAVHVPYLSSYGTLAKSVDGGASWTTLAAPAGSTVNKISKISYKGGHYFYESNSGTTYASPDLVNWTDLGSVTEVAFHLGEYWVFSSTNCRHSADLINWSSTVSMSLPAIFDVISYKGALVGMRSGVLSYSYDAVNWVPMNLGFTVVDITTSGEVLLAMGSQGQLAYTGSLPQASPSVRIASPAEDSSYLSGSIIRVNVEAYSADQSGDPTVKLYYDGILKTQLTGPPYEFNLAVGAAGQHLVHVECMKDSGPIALARKRIIVSDPPSVNHYTGFDGKNSLPGQVVRRMGVFISNSSAGIRTSVDGLNWNSASLPASAGTPQYFVDGGDRILAYTTGTKAVISLDGVNWFGVALPGTPAVKIQYSHGMFWSMTSGGAAMNGMMTSPDGINWTLRSLALAPSALAEAVGDPFGILLGRTTSTSQLWRSGDGGRSWRQITAFTFVNSVCSNGQRFFINEGNGTSRRSGSSVDGVNWVWSSLDSRNYYVQAVNGTVFARDTSGVVFSLSYDGLTWRAVNGQPNGDSIIWGEDGYFYGRGPNPVGGGNALLRSHNGVDWVVWAAWPTTDVVTLIPASNGIFASSTGGGLWHLPKASTAWTQLFSTSTTTPNLYDFDKDGSVIIAINGGDTLVRSLDDGQTWATIYDPGIAQYSLHNHTTILTLGGVWLSWSPGTRLLRSVDGLSFTDITVASGSNNFKAIACNQTTFAAIQGDGAFMVSSDGLNWTQLAAPGSFPDNTALKLVPNGTGWRALSVNSGPAFPPLMLSTSTDGVTWSRITVTGTFTSGAPVLATTSSGTIAGRSSYVFSANESTWTNTNANSSALAYQNEFYQVKSGWLERCADGTTWTQSRFFGTAFTKTKLLGSSLYLFGNGAFAKLNQQDVSISDVQATTSSYGVGATLTISFVLNNGGTNPTSAGNVETTVFLTADGFHGNADDQMLGAAMVAVPALQPGGSATLQIQARIPNLIRPGQYRAGIWFNPDGLGQETNASNNFAISRLQPVGVPGFLLRGSTVGNGVIAQDTGQRLFASGARVSLNANSGKGARFVGWGGDANGTESQVTILMDQNKNVQAIFASQVGLQMFVRGNGSISGAADEGLFDQGDTALLDAVPAAGWVFDTWSGAATGSSTSTSILMNTPKSVTASFILPMQAWKSNHFTPAELLDPLISGSDVDFDGDGLKNWQEYLHGSNPKDSLSNGMMQMRLEGGYLSLVFTRLAGVEGAYGLSSESSWNLSDWNTNALQERVLRVENGIETVEVRTPTTGQAKGFIRHKYQQ